MSFCSLPPSTSARSPLLVGDSTLTPPARLHGACCLEVSTSAAARSPVVAANSTAGVWSPAPASPFDRTRGATPALPRLHPVPFAPPDPPASAVWHRSALVELMSSHPAGSLLLPAPQLPGTAPGAEIWHVQDLRSIPSPSGLPSASPAFSEPHTRLTPAPTR
ncbi:hypothetical protein B0H10DRAFT_2212469 [Mycena sp. CBHHK59/15]|nr:hypothetical protein B0H10DRAFT_2212469 [Mycena sp. CBHHK59/15]